MEAIENEIYKLREEGRADARHYAVMKEIEAELAQLTPQYLQKLAIESISQNTKLYFGNSIPSFLNENINDLDSSLAKLTPFAKKSNE